MEAFFVRSRLSGQSVPEYQSDKHDQATHASFATLAPDTFECVHRIPGKCPKLSKKRFSRSPMRSRRDIRRTTHKLAGQIHLIRCLDDERAEGV
jgi:hypothetical protein